MDYRCPVCGREFEEAGECDSCGVDLEVVCEKCGEVVSECVCAQDEDR